MCLAQSSHAGHDRWIVTTPQASPTPPPCTPHPCPPGAVASVLALLPCRLVAFRRVTPGVRPAMAPAVADVAARVPWRDSARRLGARRSVTWCRWRGYCWTTRAFLAGQQEQTKTTGEVMWTSTAIRLQLRSMARRGGRRRYGLAAASCTVLRWGVVMAHMLAVAQRAAAIPPRTATQRRRRVARAMEW